MLILHLKRSCVGVVRLVCIPSATYIYRLTLNVGTTYHILDRPDRFMQYSTFVQIQTLQNTASRSTQIANSRLPDTESLTLEKRSNYKYE